MVGDKLKGQENTTVKCNVCGSTRFGPGPNGRMYKGQPPHCLGCGSLERGRAFFEFWTSIISYYPIRDMNCLQFSMERWVDPSWFKHYYRSIYGGENSLDLMNTGLPDACFQIILCNHVLEHLSDDLRGLQELARIVSKDGFVQFSVPVKSSLETTNDWGYPDQKLHGHYRDYGRDVLKRFREVLPEVAFLAAGSSDPVTKSNHHFFLFSHGRILQPVLSIWPRSCVITGDAPDLIDVRNRLFQ